MPPRENAALGRQWKFEACEERLALSSQPVAGYWIDPLAGDLQELAGPIVPLADGPAWSDAAAVRSQFGLSGGRQTVAVIDSGIAYDHVALGGGLGKAYRVVGGWDFAENDADPYDDGPAGFHGTHIAGILGAADGLHPGVAPGVDLVALRVFDDRGQSQFAWVEKALRWVHQHRHAFDNPITTVNISLGTDWNAAAVPEWATFEDELAQLAADGIFVSAAAGNSFMVYGRPGLSYPAVSQYVTPVASVDAGGNLSRFSQRADRVLAAPGERITSTLPDHFYGGDGIKNDWGATSGTSMAAPYVAGASVLVREAMENLGFTQIAQSTIYERLRTTADLVYDAATSASYRRVNLQAAIESLVGVDESSSAGEAKNLGLVGNQLQVSGTIGRVDDQDFFRFTAGQSGTATLTLASPSQVAASWQLAGGVGQVSGNKLTLNVQAGQAYVVGIAGGATIGKYTVDLRLAAAPGGNGAGDGGGSGPAGPVNPVPWGTVEQMSRHGLNLRTGENWFQVTAGRPGVLTVEAMFRHARGNIDLEVYNSQQRLIGSSRTSGNVERIDVSAGAGQTFFVRAVGANSDVDFRLTNLVSHAGSAVQIAGTAGNDAFIYHADARLVSIGGVTYGMGRATSVHFAGSSGYDTAILVGGAAAEHATLRPGSVQLVGGGLEVSADNVEVARVLGGRSDTAALYDSAGRDWLEAGPTSVTLAGSGFHSIAQGFGNVTVHATAGSGDHAVLLGSSGDDRLRVWKGVRILEAGGVQIRTENFQSARFYAGAGFDEVHFHTAGKPGWIGGQDSTGTLRSQGFTTELADAETLLAYAKAKHKLRTELAALDYLFRRIGL